MGKWSRQARIRHSIRCKERFKQKRLTNLSSSVNGKNTVKQSLEDIIAIANDLKEKLG